MPGCRVEAITSGGPDLLHVAAHGACPGGRCPECGGASRAVVQPLSPAPSRPTLAWTPGVRRIAGAAVLPPGRALRPAHLRRAPAGAGRVPCAPDLPAGQGAKPGRCGARGRGGHQGSASPSHARERGHGAAAAPAPAGAAGRWRGGAGPTPPRARLPAQRAGAGGTGCGPHTLAGVLRGGSAPAPRRRAVAGDRAGDGPGPRDRAQVRPRRELPGPPPARPRPEHP